MRLSSNASFEAMVLGLLALALIPQATRAATITKAATGTDLAVGTSWGGTAPGSGDVATWASTSLGASLTLDSNASWGGIAISGAQSAIGITGAGTLTLGSGGIDMSTSTVNLTVANKIALNATQSWNVANSRTLTTSGIISGGFGLTKSGAGTLTIGSTSNTYTGATVVSNGTLKLLPGASGTFVPLANIAATAANNQYGNISNTVAWIGMDRGTQASPDKNALASNNYANQWTPGANLAWGKWDLDKTATNSSFNIGNVFWWQYSQGGYTDRGMRTAKLYYSNMETDPGVPGDGNSNWTQFYDNTGGTAFPLSGGVNNHHAVVDLPGLNFAARWIGILPTSPTGDISGMGTILFTTADVPGGSLPSSTALSIASGATFDLNGTFPGQTIASLSDSGGGGGTVTNSDSKPVTLTINPSSGSTTFSGAIGGPVSLVKSGIATQVLTGASTHTGGTAVSEGTLLVNAPGSITGAVSVASGATLGGTGAITGNVTFATGASALFTHGAQLTFTGPVTLNNNTVHLALPANLADGNYLLATGSFSGAFALAPVIDSGSTVSTNRMIATSASEVRLIVSSADIFPPTPDPMTFAVKPAALNSSSVVMTATTATEGFSPPVQYYFENTTNGNNSGWTTATVWTDTGLTAATTYGYRVKARDQLGNTTAWSVAADIVTPGWPATNLYWDGGTADIAGNGNGASLGGSGMWNTALRNWDLGSAYPHVAWDNSNNDTAVFGGTAGTVTLGTVAAGSVTFGTFTGTYTLTGGSLAISSNLTVGATSGNVTLSTPVSGNGGMVKNGANTLTLNNTSTYTGGTVLNGGYINQAGAVDGVFGTGPVTLNNGANVQFAQQASTNQWIINSGTFYGGNSFADYNSGPITLNGQLTVDTGGTGNRSLNGIISGAGSILKTGSGNGAVYLFGNNTYSGGTTNQGGKLGLGHTNALGTGTLVMDGTTQTLSAEANLNVGTGVTNNIVLSKNCIVQLWGGIYGLTNYDMLLSGNISGPGGMTITGPIKKLILSGTNTYAGATIISAGALQCNKPNALGSGALSIATGAKIHFNFVGTRQISQLTLNGISQPNGTYGSTSSIAANKNDTWFSGPGTVTVGPMGTPTTTTLALTSGVNPSNGGVVVTFTATVNGSSPTGNVMFYDGLTPLGIGALNGSFQATFSTSTLGAGPHSITAVYMGAAGIAPSNSAELSHTVIETRPATTTSVALTAGANPSNHNAAVTFTASVTGVATTGSVTFYNGSAILGSAVLNNSGLASLTTRALKPGWSAITASYPGDIANAPSQSASAHFQTVNPPAGNGKLKVFIVAGQSNMVGYGSVENGRNPNNPTGPSIPGGLGSLRNMLNSNPNKYGYLANPAQPIAGGSPGWITRSDAWITYYGGSSWEITPNVSRRNGNLDANYGADAVNGLIGPEYGFGLVVGSQLADQVLIIKYAHGGRSLAADFRPPSSGGTVGPCYTDMLAAVHKVLNNIAAEFPAYSGGASGYEIAGFGWHQGWNDRVTAGYVEQYEVNLTNLIKDLRTEFNAPNMRVSIGNTGMANAGSDAASLNLIIAQANVANPTLHPEFAGTVATVDTRPFDYGELSGVNNQGYHWYYNGESYFNIGERMGQAMMTLLPPINTLPAVTAQSVITPENTALPITLSGSDPENSPLTYTIVTHPAHGTLSGSGSNYSYTPTANYYGPDSFTFASNDGSYASDAATVSITVTPSPFSTWANGSFANAFTDKDPAHDPDGDGQSNQEEFAFGLDPTTGSSVNPITRQLAGGVFKYTRTKDSGLTYKVYYSTNLSAWTLDASATQSPATAVAGVETVTVTLAAAAPSNGKLFVRVAATPTP